MLGHDPESVAGAKVDTQILKRAWTFARPYRGMIAGFLLTIVLDAVLVLAPPLLLRQMLDVAIPSGNRTQVWVLAGLIVLAALGDALLSVAQRWWSARIGEGLIYELRSALFDRVQRMPIAFFTRTQTGALISRMNNDVIGAQNAVTGTLGSVVSNVITLTLTLVAMLALEWHLTVIALLVLPLFVLPAKRVGRRLQTITREQMNLNASMNTTMTERFNVSGAMLVKLFGDPDAEAASFSNRASRVPRHRHQERDVRPRVLRRSRSRRGRRHCRDLRLGRPARHLRDDHDRHARRPRCLRRARLRTAHQPHQRAGRRHDGPRLVRAGLRGARRAEPDRGRSGRRRPDRPGR